MSPWPPKVLGLCSAGWLCWKRWCLCGLETRNHGGGKRAGGAAHQKGNDAKGCKSRLCLKRVLRDKIRPMCGSIRPTADISSRAGLGKQRTAQEMTRYKFHTAPRHKRQYRDQLLRMPKERLRGAIRGTAWRERGLVPGGIKTRLRRRRRRLVEIYVKRFGLDDFATPFTAIRLPSIDRPRFLPGGYAWWRERLTVNG